MPVFTVHLPARDAACRLSLCFGDEPCILHAFRFLQFAPGHSQEHRVLHKAAALARNLGTMCVIAEKLCACSFYAGIA